MFFNRMEAKMRARVSMRQAKPNVMLVGLVYVLATVGVATVINRLIVSNSFDIFTFYTYLQAGYDPTDIFNFMVTNLVGVGFLSTIASLVVSIYTIVVAVGLTSYCMRVARHEEAGYHNLMDGFAFFGRAIGTYIIQNIYVFLWTLVAILPGMILMILSAFVGMALLFLGLAVYIAGVIFGISVSYRYRLSFYYLIDNPNMKCTEAITTSKNTMVGKKGSLFALDLSFLGWSILAMLTWGIASIWVAPYYGTVEANFYDWAQHGRYSAPDNAGNQPPEFM